MKSVTVNQLVKKYGDAKSPVEALKGISFEVEKGELFGLIGPDGAGKTSLFRILTTLLLPDGGSATVIGLDVVRDYKEIRRKVGYMPGKFSLYQDLTVAENLDFFATIFNTSIRENYELIKDIYEQIEPFRDRRAGKLSGGMKQKLALSCALIHRPEIIFLDEPTTGVDTVSRKEFWEILKRLKQQGITILASTPYMDEAALCDRVALIQEGELLSVNTPDAITSGFRQPLFAIKAPDMLQLLDSLKAVEGVEDIYPFGEFHHLVIKEAASVEDVIAKLQQGNQPVEYQPVKPAIEDCFLELMKH